MKNYTLTKQQIQEIVSEYSFNGKYEGDNIFIGSFRRRALPKPILVNVMRAIKMVVGKGVTSTRYNSGEYDTVEIPLFGQLLTYLSGKW